MALSAVVLSSKNPAKDLLASGEKRLSAFQHQVLSALCQVPPGKATTYKLLADYIGCKSCQAVGQALRRNPYAPTVPCHRVVAHSGAVGGFGGTRCGAKIDAKMKLLRQEGVLMDDNGHIDTNCIYKFETNA
ncbi:hypothetical protein ACA910_004185 [Epithemia clementina (nom. ined.)]